MAHKFSKAIVWGCPLHQHTNSYVYAGFYKAFRAMGFDAYWLNEKSDVSGMDFSNSIFVTEGQHDGNIPLRGDCKYVLHNCHLPKYQEIKEENKLALQTFTYDATNKWKAAEIAEGSYLLPDGKCLFQSWGTDLLPNEINLDWADIKREKESHYVGTVCGGRFGNNDEIGKFRRACDENGIRFHHHPPGSASFEENMRLIQRSYIAPALHGTWQAENGYLSCRLFKNISYGHLGVANSKASFDLFHGQIIYNEDEHQLFYDARPHLDDKKRIVELMKLVRDKHTYVNRINTILSVFDRR